MILEKCTGKWVCWNLQVVTDYAFGFLGVLLLGFCGDTERIRRMGVVTGKKGWCFWDPRNWSCHLVVDILTGVDPLGVDIDRLR